jgi:hypothetical protein
MVKLKVYYLVKGESHNKVVEEEDRRIGFLDSLHNVNLVVQFRKPDGRWGPVAGRWLREERYYPPYSSKAKKRR